MCCATESRILCSKTKPKTYWLVCTYLKANSYGNKVSPNTSLRLAVRFVQPSFFSRTKPSAKCKSLLKEDVIPLFGNLLFFLSQETCSFSMNNSSSCTTKIGKCKKVNYLRVRIPKNLSYGDNWGFFLCFASASWLYLNESFLCFASSTYHFPLLFVLDWFPGNFSDSSREINSVHVLLGNFLHSSLFSSGYFVHNEHNEYQKTTKSREICTWKSTWK